MNDRDSIKGLFERLFQEWEAFDRATCDATEDEAA